MLRALYLKNFAIIDEQQLTFYDKFTVITGETGAGKSILVNALLILSGQKADETILKDKNQKAIIEAIFNQNTIAISEFLSEHEIDNQSELILRREILPSGTTRQFINDTPVNITTLKDIASLLLDIHSQHQNILLRQQVFQLQIVDAFAKTYADLIQYKEIFKKYKDTKQQLNTLLAKQKEEQQKTDYWLYQQKEFESLIHSAEEFAEIEAEFQSLQHSEEILEKLHEIHGDISENEQSFVDRLKTLSKNFQSVSSKFSKAQNWLERAESILSELKDLDYEILHTIDKIEANPERFFELQTHIDYVYKLMHKYKISSYTELIQLKEEINEKLSIIGHLDDEIEQLKKQTELLQGEVYHLSEQLHSKRTQAATTLKKPIEEQLKSLGMPHATLSINLEKLAEPIDTGITHIHFLFSANPKIAPQPIDKIASGGELSRLLLTLKSLNANNNTPPTIILDEADSGISGEIAFKAGNLMKNMASQKQVIAITHLPQIAACGDYHLFVQKLSSEKGTRIQISYIEENQRIQEIAKLLSADKITPSALEQAQHLLSVSHQP